jgi:hypothetical protein
MDEIDESGQKLGGRKMRVGGGKLRDGEKCEKLQRTSSD